MTPAEQRSEATSSVLVPHDATSVGTVRRALADSLAAQGVDPASIDDALLVVSELLGNAVRHAEPLPSGRIRAGWTLRDTQLDLAVTDGGSGTAPVANVATMTAVGGRGLDIVRRLSIAWGVDQEGPRVTVWATLPLDGDPSPGPR